MPRHIAFCLEEIEAEIEADHGSVLDRATRDALGTHIASMRALLEQVRGNPRNQLSSLASAKGTAGVKGDDFSLIRGVDAQDLALLAAKGVTTYRAIADWRRGDIDALGGGKQLFRRIAQEGWIEQAALLASGKLTHFAQSRQQPTAETPAAPEAVAGDAPIAVESSGNVVAMAATQAERGRRRTFVHAAAVALIVAGLGLFNTTHLPATFTIAGLSQQVPLR